MIGSFKKEPVIGYLCNPKKSRNQRRRLASARWKRIRELKKIENDKFKARVAEFDKQFKDTVR